MSHTRTRARDGDQPPPRAVWRPCARAVWPGLAILALLGGTAPAGEATPVFDNPSPVITNEGHATLSWRLPGLDPGAAQGLFQVQQSMSEEFTGAGIRHEGPQTSLFISGLGDGSTYFRVRALAADGRPGPWSRPLEVTVVYPARGRVILLLILGGVVFLASVAAIVAGWWRTRGGETPETEPA